MPSQPPNEAPGEIDGNSMDSGAVDPVRRVKEAEEEAADRSVNVLTEFSDYFFRIRDPSRIREHAALAVELAPQAFKLWKVRDSLEYDDLLEALSASPPSLELIAAIMLTGKSKQKSKSDAARGGTAKRANSFGPMQEKLQSDWGAYVGKLTKRAFAMRRYNEWVGRNAELERAGLVPVPLPAPDTPQKWLANVPNALKKEELQRMAERNAELEPTGAALVGRPAP